MEAEAKHADRRLDGEMDALACPRTPALASMPSRARSRDVHCGGAHPCTITKVRRAVQPLASPVGTRQKLDLSANTLGGGGCV